MSTQGSLARSKSPAAARQGATAARNGCSTRVQLRPPSADQALTSARAPPLLARSCCQMPTIASGLAGDTATKGSASASTKIVPPALPPSQPGATGVAPLTVRPERTDGGGGGAVGSPPPPLPPHAASSANRAAPARVRWRARTSALRRCARGWDGPWWDMAALLACDSRIGIFAEACRPRLLAAVSMRTTGPLWSTTPTISDWPVARASKGSGAAGRLNPCVHGLLPVRRCAMQAAHPSSAAPGRSRRPLRDRRCRRPSRAAAPGRRRPTRRERRSPRPAPRPWRA
jgi:hypothetical protein